MESLLANERPFLRNIEAQRGITKVNYFEACAYLYWHNYFSKQFRLPIWSRTISESLGQIGSIFEDNSFENPVKIPYSTHCVRNIHKLLLSQKAVDPPTKRQASLLCVFKDLLDDKYTALDEAIGEITNGALHFAMRSCDYSTATEKNPRTNRLKIRNIAFYNSLGHRPEFRSCSLCKNHLQKSEEWWKNWDHHLHMRRSKFI